MTIKSVIDRFKSKEFWKRVVYWTGIKWTGNKTKPIPKDDWLPIITSIAACILLAILIIFLITLVK